MTPDPVTLMVGLVPRRHAFCQRAVLTEPLDSGEGINRVTQYTYACQDSYLATVINADSHTASYTYGDCSIGKPSSHTDTNGAVYAYTYSDPLLRLTGVSEAGGLGQVDYSYVDTLGAVSVTATRQQDSCSGTADIVAKTDYDGFGRPVKSRTTDDTGNIYVETLYDGFGSVARRSDPYRTTPIWTETTYDPLGRPLATQRLDDNSATRLGYLLDKTYVRDPAGKWRMNRTDALGRLVEVVEDPLVDGSATNPIPGYTNSSGAGLGTLYTYDGRDNLLSVTQGTQPARVFTYDALGRLWTAYNPESDTTTYTYYDNGNLKTKTDSDNIVAASAWDKLNRIKAKSYTGGVSTPTVTYCYDGDTEGSCEGAPTGIIERGNLTMVTNSAITAKYVHADGLRRVTASSQQFASDAPYAFSYTYNKAGGLETETFPSNRQVKTCYTQAGQPKSVQNPATSLNYASSVEYAAHGGMTSATLGNGLTETWGYTRMQPTSMAAGSLLSATLSYGSSDNNGNVMGRTINDGTTTFSQSFVYDPLNRLTSLTESVTGLSQTYAYDQWGNRAVTAGWVPGASLTPQALTAYNTNTNRWTGVGVDYNNRGLQTALPARGYTFDAESRVVTATDTMGTSAQYAYDGEGRRVKKTVNSAETRFVYDAFGRLAAEYGSAPGPCSTCYLTADHLGSTRLVTNQSGTVVKRYDYVPFGEEIPTGFFNRGSAYSSGSYPAQPDAAASLKFTGKERDAETGLDFFGARYFAAAQGRFTSPDEPLIDQEQGDPQSWNLYSYARNNPLRYTDPTGHQVCFADNPGYQPSCTDMSGPQIGPLPQTTGLGQTKDRAVGAVKGLANGVLDLASLLGAPDANVDQIRGFLHLYPASKNQQFGAELGGILGMLLPGGEAGKTGELLEAASSAKAALGLKKALASERQMSEIIFGGGEVIAGRGASVALRGAPRLSADYGGATADWVKVTSSSFKAADGTRFEIHAYKNLSTGKIVEFKTKLQ